MLGFGSGVPVDPLQRAAVVLAFLLALVVVSRLDPTIRRVRVVLRRRFVLGVPWGTLTVATLVLFAYLFVQGGLTNWNRPVVIPFRAWSYFYPLGMLTAAFTHTGPNHLIGNLIGTLVFAPLAEYALGHYPRRRGSSSFESWSSNPYVRAFVVFPGVVFVVGVLTSVFALGPVIGFSGVVFAFAGFALVYYPLATVLALVAGRVVRLGYFALLDPTLTAKAQPTFSTPWWAQIAVQGHALGLFVGVLLGVWLLRRRGDTRPPALRSWAGVLLFSVSQSLWAVYWFRGNETFVLYRAAGLVLVVTLATLVAVTVAAGNRPLVDSGVLAWRPTPLSIDLAPLSTPRWQVGAVVLLLAVSGISGPAIPYNLTVVDDENLPGDSVRVRDYEITYAEDVPSGLTAAIQFEAFGESTNVTTSGVIVRSHERGIWTTAVSKGRLAFAGETAVRVGGLGWRETVVVNRTGWSVVGGNATYRINLTHEGQTATVFVAPPAPAEPVIDGRNVSVVTEDDRFLLDVSRGNESARAPIPEVNESVVIDGIRFVREDTDVFAVAGETRVRVATQERYRGQGVESTDSSAFLSSPDRYSPSSDHSIR